MLDLPGFFASASATAKPLYVFDQHQFTAWREQQSADTQAWLQSVSFNAAPGIKAQTERFWAWVITPILMRMRTGR